MIERAEGRESGPVLWAGKGAGVCGARAFLGGCLARRRRAMGLIPMGPARESSTRLKR
jgi:hypothetical protein